MKERLSKCIGWSLINKEDYLFAMERSPVNSLEIKSLLEKSLTMDIKDREVFMKGLQKSYEYEDYYIEV